MAAHRAAALSSAVARELWALQTAESIAWLARYRMRNRVVNAPAELARTANPCRALVIEDESRRVSVAAPMTRATARAKTNEKTP